MATFPLRSGTTLEVPTSATPPQATCLAAHRLQASGTVAEFAALIGLANCDKL
jgi:hypothetical protein